MIKKYFKRLHLWLSLPLGLIISITCLSGAALVFEKEIRQWANPSVYFVGQREDNRLPPSELMERLKPQLADSLLISSLQFSGDPYQSCQITFSNLKRTTLYADPYTGQVLGWVNANQGFFSMMRKLHRWLLDDYKRGEFSIGKTIVGVSTLVFVFILISGIVIWIPKNRKSLRHRLKISLNKGWRRFWYDCHAATGFYAMLFLLVLALTGLTWSFSWYRTAFYSLFSPEDKHPLTTSISHHRSNSSVPPLNYEAWDKILTQAKNHYPSYAYIRLTAGKAEISPRPVKNMRKPDIIHFHPHTGKLQEIIPYKNQDPQQKVKGWVYAIHTGIWGGLLTKILTFLAALTGGILPLSGYYLWLKKKFSRR